MIIGGVGFAAIILIFLLGLMGTMEIAIISVILLSVCFGLFFRQAKIDQKKLAVPFLFPDAPKVKTSIKETLRRQVRASR